MPLGGRAIVRHSIWLGLVAAAFAVAGCASADHAAPPAPGGVAAVTSPVITGSRDGHTVAYALAATQWTMVALPHRPADGQSVAAHGHDIYAAVRQANGITLEASHDGGQSWQRRPVAGTSDPGTVDLALSPDGTRLAIVLDHPGAAGAVGQAAVLLGEAKGGAFTSHDAPAGGRVTWWNGRLALSGGVSSRLYVSDAKASTWTPVAVGRPVAPLRNVDPGVASIGVPIDQPDGSLLVPVTNHAASPSVDLFATSDGSTFRKVAGVALSGELGAGAAAPVAALPDGAVLVADPNTVRLHVVQGSAQTSFVPRGLPAPPSTMTFATATMGIARVDTANCASGKIGCTVRSEVYTTTDGGKSWNRS
jgi:hypothetical protein